MKKLKPCHHEKQKKVHAYKTIYIMLKKLAYKFEPVIVCSTAWTTFSNSQYSCPDGEDSDDGKFDGSNSNNTGVSKGDESNGDDKSQPHINCQEDYDNDDKTSDVFHDSVDGQGKYTKKSGDLLLYSFQANLALLAG